MGMWYKNWANDKEWLRETIDCRVWLITLLKGTPPGSAVILQPLFKSHHELNSIEFDYKSMFDRIKGKAEWWLEFLAREKKEETTMGRCYRTQFADH